MSLRFTYSYSVECRVSNEKRRPRIAKVKGRNNATCILSRSRACVPAVKNAARARGAHPLAVLAWAPMTSRPAPAVRRPELWFHELNLTDVWALRKRAGTMFELAECRGRRPPCVPDYLRTWQRTIRKAVLRHGHDQQQPLRWTGTCAVVGSC